MKMQNSTNQNETPAFRETCGMPSEAEQKYWDHVRELEEQAWREDKDFDLGQYLEDPETMGRYRSYLWKRGEAAMEEDKAREEAWERAQEELAPKQPQQGQ